MWITTLYILVMGWCYCLWLWRWMFMHICIGGWCYCQVAAGYNHFICSAGWCYCLADGHYRVGICWQMPHYFRLCFGWWKNLLCRQIYLNEILPVLQSWPDFDGRCRKITKWPHTKQLRLHSTTSRHPTLFESMVLPGTIILCLSKGHFHHQEAVGRCPCSRQCIVNERYRTSSRGNTTNNKKGLPWVLPSALLLYLPMEDCLEESHSTSPHLLSWRRYVETFSNPWVITWMTGRKKLC